MLRYRYVRIVAAVSAAAVACSVLVGCGSGSRAARETEPGSPESVGTQASSRLDRITDAVRADGTYPKQAALDYFALAYGPMPGARVDAGRTVDVSGTVATGAVFNVWPEIDEAQRNVVRGRLGLPDGFDPDRDARAISGPGESEAGPGRSRPVLGPGDSPTGLAWRTSVDASLRAIEGHLGPLSVPTHIVTAHHDTGGGDREFGDAVADTLLIGGSCRIRVFTSRWGGIPTRATMPLGHELFHCYQQATNPSWWREPAWILEGSASWVGQASTLDAGGRVDNSMAREHLSSYLGHPGRGLFARSYDAFGFYLHASARGVDLWPIVLPLQRASNDAGWGMIVPLGTDTLATFPSAMFWSEEQGPYWIDRWQGIPPVPAPPVRREAVGNSASTSLLSGEAAAAVRVVDLRADITTITVTADTFGLAYVDLATRAIGELSGQWCTTPGRCTCPEGTRRAGYTFRSLRGGATPIGITGGRFAGRAEIRGQSLEDACEREIACPVGTWQMNQRPTGLPYEIQSGGTGTVLTVDERGNVTEDFGPFVEQTVRFPTDPDGLYHAKVDGILRARIAMPPARDRFTSAEITDVDGSGLGGHGSAVRDGQTVLELGADEVRGLAAIGPEYGAVTLSCATPGVVTLSGAGISQTFEPVP